MTLEWEETFRQLQRQFVGLTLERLGRMHELLERSKKGVYDPNSLKELMGHFHSLKGSGQSYGFPEITRQCKLAQETCQGLLESQTCPDAAQIKLWENSLDSLSSDLKRFEKEGVVKDTGK